MSKVHIVNHTHWDREWYFTTADALVLSESCFTQVLDELNNNQDAMFCLDGQTSILDDYVRLKPERAKQIESFIKQGRLAIGPWYTQTDAFFVNAESIIRNLTIGIRDSLKYGGYMNVGYLPDTFGFNAQMPTILKNCGIDNIVFWRGINFKKHAIGPYFKWQGLGGQEIIAVNLVDGYGAAAHLQDTDEYIAKRLVPVTNKLKQLTDSDEIIMASGGDQLDIIQDLPQKLTTINKQTKDCYEVSTYAHFLKYLRQQKNLKLYIGELREPCESRVHKSIGSVRYDIKLNSFLLEQKLLYRVEPMMAIARAKGIHIGEKLLSVAWKKLLEGHAHDSMGGCISDDVATDVLHRMKEANEIADGIENMMKKRLSEQMQLTEQELLIVNTTPFPFSGLRIIEFMSPSKNIKLVDCEDAVILEAIYYEGRSNILLETPKGPRYIQEEPYYMLRVLAPIELPSMGYRVIKYENSNHSLLELESSSDKSIANKYCKIFFEEDQLKLTTHFGKTIDNFIEFEDCANDGDTYDFSPLKGDIPKLLSLELKKVRKSSLMEMMTLEGTFHLPLNLKERLKENGRTGTLSIKLQISLLKDVDRVECVCIVDNQVYTHRLRAKINTNIKAKETISSVPFGFINRPVLNGDPVDWENEYVEIPTDIEPYDASVAVESNEYHFTVFSKGMKEYQFIEDSFYLTLFASTSQLGKPDLLYRPGRASGDTTKKGHVMIPTPKAELIGTHQFNFAFRIAEDKYDEESTAKCWEDYTVEHISYQSQTLNKFIHRLDNKLQPREQGQQLSYAFSLLEVPKDNHFSSLSPSLYEDNAFLLRLKNPTDKFKRLTDYKFTSFTKIAKVNCIEELLEEDEYIIPPYDMLTLKLWL